MYFHTKLQVHSLKNAWVMTIWISYVTSLASRVMPKQSQNEINKYCSCYSEYIYKCQDFCDGSGNELWPLPQSVPYNLKYLNWFDILLILPQKNVFCRIINYWILEFWHRVYCLESINTVSSLLRCEINNKQINQSGCRYECWLRIGQQTLYIVYIYMVRSS